RGWAGPCKVSSEVPGWGDLRNIVQRGARHPYAQKIPLGGLRRICATSRDARSRVARTALPCVLLKEDSHAFFSRRASLCKLSYFHLPRRRLRLARGAAP